MSRNLPERKTPLAFNRPCALGPSSGEVYVLVGRDDRPTGVAVVCDEGQKPPLVVTDGDIGKSRWIRMES